MSLVVKTKNDIDRYLVFFSFLEMLFLRWVLIGQDTIILLYCCALTFRLLTLPPGYRKSLTGNFLLFVLTGLLLVFNGVFRDGFDGGVFLKNLNYILLPAVVIFYFGYIISNRLEMLEDIFLALRGPLNWYYALNVVIIMLQRGETYFLMPVDRIDNAYYPDHMAGLLGIDGTHRLALVTVFVILLNMYYLKKHKTLTRGKKLLNIGYLAFAVVTALYVSAINDNNMVFVLLPLLILLYLMVGYRNTKSNVFKLMLLGAAAIVGLYIVFNTSLLSAFSSIRINNILNSFFGVFKGTGTGDERMKYLLLVFEEYGGLFLGTGFGSLQMRRDPAIVALGYEYRNWGMSDIAPFIAMGGLACYIWILYLHARTCAANQKLKRLRKYFAVIILILTYYHQVLTHATMAIPMCWILAMFALQLTESKGTEQVSFKKDR